MQRSQWVAARSQGGVEYFRHPGLDPSSPTSELHYPENFAVPIQPVDATHALKRCAGVSNPKVCLGRSFSLLAIEIRAYVKSHFSELKEKHIKNLLDRKIWLEQKQTLLKVRQLQQAIGAEQNDDMNGFEAALKAACKKQNVKLDSKEKNLITGAVSWKNPDAEKVIKKIHKTKANPMYGLFSVEGQTIEYKADGDLRDHENVALNPKKSVNALNAAYFKKEVQPHVPDAWIDASKKDSKDQEIGIVGYEIPFNRHFYQYQPPRALAEIDADLDRVSTEIMELLREVRS